MTVGGKVAIP